MLHHMQLRKSEERMQQLGKSLGKVTTPSGLSGSKSDLDIWRTIIKLILDANIINTKGAIAFETVDQFDIVQRLMSVQSHIVKGGLVSFKLILQRHPFTISFCLAGAMYADMMFVIQSNSFRYSESRLLLTEVFAILMSCIQFQFFLTDNQTSMVITL